LQLRTQLEPGAHALLTTPGAGKWYKANGHAAQQQLHFSIASNATLEWLPQETIVFDAAQAQMQTRVELHGDAKYAGWEIICLGRRAAGEKFASGSLQQRAQIFRDGELIFNDTANLRAGDRVLLSPVGLNGHSVSATFIIAAGKVPSDIVDACREIIPRARNEYGLTALPEIFIARCIGDNAEQVREYFEMLWKIMRPWYAGIDMQRPRIWST
jgi:urease accessory protein